MKRSSSQGRLLSPETKTPLVTVMASHWGVPPRALWSLSGITGWVNCPWNHFIIIIIIW